MRVWVLVALLLVVSVHAEFEAVQPPALPSGDDVVLTLELYDENNQPLRNTHARIELSNPETELTTLKYVKDGTLTLNLARSQWDLRILVDDISTPGKDYYYTTTITLKTARLEQIFLIPTGSIQGTIYQNDKAVPNAKVILYCTDQKHETQTDISGAFSVEWIPIGQCKITAASNERRGEALTQIEQGDLADIEINLSEGLAQQRIWLIPLSIIATLLLIGIALRTKKPKKQPEKRTQDILQTLNDREREITTYLLEHSKKSTQATLKNETGIPKTTLLRIFASLEAKHIITIEKVGKMKKITLTDWFLGKNENGPKKESFYLK